MNRFMGLISPTGAVGDNQGVLPISTRAGITAIFAGDIGICGDGSGVIISRRDALTAGLACAAGLALPVKASAAVSAESAVRPALLRRALAAFERHGAAFPARDVIGIADFAVPSRKPRFHLLDMASGRATTLLVAHGRGSDPGHSGWLERFSNEFGSAASSEGAYRTGDEYSGKHGRSRRLIGLDPQNCNAEPRAIVIHSAWYVGPQIIREHGKLGRSEGCFVFAEADLDQVLRRLGPGRMIYAAKA